MTSRAFSQSRPASRGFTLVEMLVVVTIIGLLAGLTLPAVQGALEASRRSTCANNLSQLAKGMARHESGMGHFMSGGWGPAWLGVANRGSDSGQPGGWAFSMLPYIEETGLLAAIESVDATTATAAYTKFASRSVPILACPSRRRSSAIPVAADLGGFRSAASASMAIPRVIRTDYAANGGSTVGCPSIKVLKGVDLPSGGGGGGGGGGSNQVTIGHVTGSGSCNEITVNVNALAAHFEHGDFLGGCPDAAGSGGTCGLSPDDPAFQLYQPTDMADGDAKRNMPLGQRFLTLSDRARPDLHDGLVYRMSRLLPAKIEDGLSNTYLFGEKYVRSDTYQSGTDPGDRTCTFAGYSASTIRWASALPENDQRELDRPTSFGAAHQSSWNAAFADGSVRQISYTIDLGVHRALAGRADGIVVKVP